MILFVAFLSLAFVVGLVTLSKSAKERAFLLFVICLVLSFAYFVFDMI